MTVRPFEGTFWTGLILGGFVSLAFFVCKESGSLGAGLALAAGFGVGFALRHVRARDEEAHQHGIRAEVLKATHRGGSWHVTRAYSREQS